MAYETSKAVARHITKQRFTENYFVGCGIDIGAGEDSLSKYAHLFHKVKSIKSWDIEEGNAEFMEGVPNEYFDFVYSSNCLEHLQNPLQALQNWWRILKQDGYLVFTVPDEDLYEQGNFPSIYNADHKHTFTIYKHRTWSPNSINMLQLLVDLGQDLAIIKIEQVDTSYNYGLSMTDQTLTPTTEAFIEVICRKQSTMEMALGGGSHLSFHKQDLEINLLQNDNLTTLKKVCC